MNTFLIYPNQLFKNIQNLQNKSSLIIKHPKFFSELNFNKKKIILLESSINEYKNYLNNKNIKVEILDLSKEKNPEAKIVKELKSKQVFIYNLIDTQLQNKLKKELSKNKIDLEILDSQAFYCNEERIENIFNENKFFLTSFYIKQRKEFNILVENEKPIGGKWTFDKDNRQKLTNLDLIPDHYYIPQETSYTKKAIKEVEKNYKNNLGNTKKFFYPTSFYQAEKLLDDFLENRLKLFGTYQDAILKNQSFVFHSILSSSINIGLLTPEYVINKTLDFAKKHKTPINSLEGFIRQILGWREYVRAVYVKIGEKQFESNYFENNYEIPKAFWNAQTGIEPIDNTIKKSFDTAYAHHIERLMILGNFMLLCEFNPKEVYNWFMEVFIDSYEWVMIPNAMGMSQFADGGLITTKPYISSSNYILGMSDYKKGNWSKIWDSLFWRFVYKKRKKIEEVGRSNILIYQLNKKKKSELKNIVKIADTFLESMY